MGLPALKYDRATEESVRPHLRPVRTPASRPRSTSASVSVSRLCGSVFAIAVVCAALGVLRVWMSVGATQASAEGVHLRERISQARFEGEMLEVRLSALEDPERVRAVVGPSMVSAADVQPAVIELTSGPSVASAEPKKQRGRTPAVLTNLLDLAAGESQVLLVGDVGLASVER